MTLVFLSHSAKADNALMLAFWACDFPYRQRSFYCGRFANMYRDANIFDMHKAQMINTVNRYMQQNVSGAWHGVQSGQTSLNIEVK